MDDIQCPAPLPRRHRVAFDDPLHADDEIRVATIQQIDPLMTVRDQPAQLLSCSASRSPAMRWSINCAHARRRRDPLWAASCNKTVKVASAGSGNSLVGRVLRGMGLGWVIEVLAS